VLQQHALDVAKTYPNDQQAWLGAAQNLRAPYWDWATNSVPPSEVISLQNINIITPGGRRSVPNPLIQYTFNPIDPSFPTPWSRLRTTIRSPNSRNVTDVEQLKRYDSYFARHNLLSFISPYQSDLSSIQRDITSSTYNLCARVRTWPAFSNHSAGDGGSSSNSLEAIHDEIHGTIGGHMGYPEVAGNELGSKVFPDYF
jgi:tyrosinase